LRENDISVSRLHAFIRLHNGEFLITDNNSKFGTLVLLRKNYELERKKIALQIGRTVVTFSLKQSSNSEKSSIDQIELKRIKKELLAYEGENLQQHSPHPVNSGNYYFSNTRKSDFFPRILTTTLTWLVE